MHYKETQYGFEYGDAKISRFSSDEKKGWITLGLQTSKYSSDKEQKDIQIYVTKTGKVRVHDHRGEWTPPEGKI